MFYWKNKSHHLFGAFAAGLVVILAACESPRNEAGFYPIDSLVTAQVNGLFAASARLKKEVVLGEKMDTITIVPDSLDWVKELGIFSQLQVINKPINHNKYHVEDGLRDPASNLVVKAFTTTENLPVRYMRIYYQHAIEKPRRIEASYAEENSLYKSTRLLTMEFQQVNNKTVLNSYSIRGGQKILLGDSVTFFIGGKIFIGRSIK